MRHPDLVSVWKTEGDVQSCVFADTIDLTADIPAWFAETCVIHRIVIIPHASGEKQLFRVRGTVLFRGGVLFSFFQVIEIPSDPSEIFPVTLGVPVLKEIFVAAVNGLDLSGMFDGTPVLLGPGAHFLDIRDHTVEITAVYAVYLFKYIQVLEIMMVDYYVFAPFYLGYIVDREI